MQSELVRFRIFAARDPFRDSKKARPVQEFRLKDGIRLAVSVGAVPEDLVAMNSLANPILEGLLSANLNPKPENVPPAWEERGVVYTTLEVRQERDIASSETLGAEALVWYDVPSADLACSEFKELSRSAMDGLTAKLVAAVGAELLHKHLHDSRVFIRAEGKVAQPVIQVRFGDPTVHLMRPASELDLSGLQNLQVRSAVDIAGKKVAVGRWFTLAVGEVDPFKKLMWAYAGLEVLARRAATSWRDEALSILGGVSIDTGVTKELLWPAGRDESVDPYRNTTFRFAVMALVASSATAADDIRVFREISVVRNGIHGGGGGVDQSTPGHAEAAVNLLRRYTPLVANLF